MWAIDRLRRVGMLTQQLSRTAPEVLFIDRDDAGPAPLAAALLTSYARGRVNVASAGHSPAPKVEPAVVRAMADLGIDLTEAFPKPLTDDALQAADHVIILGDTPEPVSSPGVQPRRLLRWPARDMHDVPDDVVTAVRNELDRRVLLLLADLLTPATRP